jgi:hypothetical protein
MEASYGTCIPIIRYSHAVNMLAEGEDYERSILSDEMHPYK